jgi:hypothetical protein
MALSAAWPKNFLCNYLTGHYCTRLKEIEKAWKKSGQKEGINRFLRKNGHLFGRLI